MLQWNLAALTLSSLKYIVERAQSTWANNAWSMTLHINSKRSTSHWLYVCDCNNWNNCDCHSLSSVIFFCRSRTRGGIFDWGEGACEVSTSGRGDGDDDRPPSKLWNGIKFCFPLPPVAPPPPALLLPVPATCGTQFKLLLLLLLLGTDAFGVSKCPCGFNGVTWKEQKQIKSFQRTADNRYRVGRRVWTRIQDSQ